jgi:hypothetical protein
MLGIGCCTPFADASWLDGKAFEQPKEGAGSIKAKEMVTNREFAAQFWLVSDDRAWLRWSEADIRQLNPVSVTHRNKPVNVALFFVNAGEIEGYLQRDDELVKTRLTNVTFDLRVNRPDGHVYRYADLPGWQKLAPAPYMMKLAQAKATISFDTEPLGVYTIEVVVHDKVRKVDIALRRTLEVIE